MQEIGERIKEIRKSNNLTKKEFGDMLSVAEKTIYNYETGKTPVTLEFLYKVSSVFHIDYDYLIHKPESISQSLESISEVHKSKFGVHKSSISHVPYSQNIVPKSSHSDSLVSPSQDDLSINQKSNNLVKIPVFDEVYASAGHGLINEEHISSHIELDKGFLRSYFRLTSFVDLSIIAASGDSMMPTLPENCQLLVQKGTPKEGQICVTRIDDELYVKRLQKRPKYKLISDNKSYDDIELEGENYEILGVVVGLFQKIP